ncbi:enoyl-CoA hydratase/isomerase family protein [Mesorhizobium sp.]|uniref:enoyl-CoA hydratase/isomerase family protein n=1 Tax=Mesorhizobium sp. TaxID=1871066 RepID=UPI00257E7B8E|nr:enoyl-CoA hydratase/isomerase family protein [Mesorhizobium sp.]
MKREETRRVTVAAESSRSGLPDSKRKRGHHVLSAAVFLAAVIGAAPAMAGSSDSSTAASQKNPATQESAKVSPGDPASSARQVRVERRTPSYWRVTFDNPPFNIFGPETIPQLNEVITAIENDPDLKVVVFDSAVPGFFLTHYDFIPPLSASTGLPSGTTGLHPLPDMLVRLSRAPIVSISLIRGRATGVGSELALASDMRFASHEKAILSQWEVGAALVPGGGPMARLPRLVGRGRALEILLGANDIDGDLAEKYGYVNRSFPDDQLDGFVDAFAMRVATFDNQAIADTKRLVDFASLPSDPEIAAGWNAFITSVQRPQAQAKIKQLMELGLQTDPEIEIRLGHYTETLGQD